MIDKSIEVERMEHVISVFGSFDQNLRERDDKLLCFGLHSTHGETTRADGKPWSELEPTTCLFHSWYHKTVLPSRRL